jgi:hypothetical protein
MCALPGCNRPVYVDNGRPLDYCGKTHVDEARRRSLPPPSAPYSSPTPIKTCGLPGCHKPVAIVNGSPADYCSKTHANDAKTLAPPPSSGGGGGGIIVLTGPISSQGKRCLYPSCGK